MPGTVQAANYDGGQGVAYNVGTINGTANNYRTDGVDLETTTDPPGGYTIRLDAAGQWFNYTVNVATAGTYAVSLRLAAPTAVTDALHISNATGTNLTGSVTAPATGGYQAWTTVTASAGPCRRRANADHPPGQRRLEHPLPDVRRGRRRRIGPTGGRPRRRPAPCRRRTTTPAARASPTTSPP